MIMWSLVVKEVVVADRTEGREMKSGMRKASMAERTSAARGVLVSRVSRVRVKEVVRAWVKYILVETPRRGRWPDRGRVGVGESESESESGMVVGWVCCVVVDWWFR
jgi:hypothetical protein